MLPNRPHNVLTVVVLIMASLLVSAGCGKDKTTETDSQPPSIVGSWEWLGTDHPRELFTYFRADGRFLSIELDSGDSYSDNGVGSYTLGAPSSITMDYRGDWATLTGTYVFSENGARLTLDFPSWGQIAMKRVQDAPNPALYVDTYYVWGGDSEWPQIPIEEDQSYSFLGGSNKSETFETEGHIYVVIYVYEGDRIGLDAVETPQGYIGAPHADTFTWNFGVRDHVTGPPDGLYDLLGDGQHVAAFGIHASVATIHPYVIPVAE